MQEGVFAMEIYSLSVGPLEANCYIAYSGKDSIVIDPGDEANSILSFVREKGLRVHAIVLTHGHFDHFLAAGKLQEALGAPVYIGREDLPMLTDPGWMAEYIPPGYVPPRDVRPLADGDTVGGGLLGVKVMSTPGHSPGSVCLYAPGVLFSGDLLFSGGIGRTDLPGGDPSAIKESLAKVVQLPDGTLVYPGHGPMTTIGDEKISNPYLSRRRGNL